MSIQTRSLLRFHDLEIERDLHLIAYDYAPGIKRFVPFDAIVLSVHPGGRLRSYARFPIHAFDNRARFDV
jgi:hypothetical protein